MLITLDDRNVIAIIVGAEEKQERSRFGGEQIKRAKEKNMIQLRSKTTTTIGLVLLSVAIAMTWFGAVCDGFGLDHSHHRHRDVGRGRLAYAMMATEGVARGEEDTNLHPWQQDLKSRRLNRLRRDSGQFGGRLAPKSGRPWKPGKVKEMKWKS